MIKWRNKVSGYCASCPQQSGVLHYAAAAVLTSWAMGAIRRQTDCGWLVWPSTPLSSVVFSHFNTFPCNRSTYFYHTCYRITDIRSSCQCRRKQFVNIWSEKVIIYFLVLLTCSLLAIIIITMNHPLAPHLWSEGLKTLWTSFLLFTVLTDTLDFSASLSNDCEMVEKWW